MGVSNEFRHLLEHASQRLAEEEIGVMETLERAHDTHNSEQRNEVFRTATSYLAANTYARVVMDMVATFLTDGEPES